MIPSFSRTSLSWVEAGIVTLDQRALPHEHRILRLTSVDDVIEAISSLAVRGAPSIGLAGALGVALSAHHHHRNARGSGADWCEAVRHDASRLVAARPTAVNLAWAVRRALDKLPEGPDAVLAESLNMLEEDLTVNLAAVERGVDVVLSVCADRPLRVLTHCNTGRLASAGVGTALGTIIALAQQGRIDDVLVGETRPLLQGSRLTTWELAEAKIPHRLCVDSAAPSAIARGMVDCVLVGADRIAVNADVANKIGTYSLAIAAARHNVPFVVVAPESTWDSTSPDGRGFLIEERAADEVTAFAGILVAPAGTRAFNPAFDVTPAELITAIVSERRVVRPCAALA